MRAALLGFEGVQEPLLVRGGGPGGVEDPGAPRREGLRQAAHQFAALAALHRRHADDGLGLAVFRPPAANRGYQSVEIGTRRRLFAGELGGRDRVARLTEGHDFAFEVPRGKPFRHVFREGATERFHVFEFDRSVIAAVRRRREEEQLSAALAP